MPTLTITLSAAQATRAAPVYGRKLGLRNASGQQRDATIPEVENYLRGVLRADVQADEDQINRAAVAPPASFDPT